MNSEKRNNTKETKYIARRPRVNFRGQENAVPNGGRNESKY